MRRIVRWAGVAAAVVVLGIQMVRPARVNPPTDPARTMAARLAVTPEVQAILDRSCRDCHSHDTRWPWYSNVAPVSWFVIDHVNHGRSHWNYSDWAQYRPDEASRALRKACELVRKHEMPLGTYLIGHRDATLSDADITAICTWTDSALRAP